MIDYHKAFTIKLMNFFFQPSSAIAAIFTAQTPAYNLSFSKKILCLHGRSQMLQRKKEVAARI